MTGLSWDEDHSGTRGNGNVILEGGGDKTHGLGEKGFYRKGADRYRETNETRGGGDREAVQEKSFGRETPRINLRAERRAK